MMPYAIDWQETFLPAVLALFNGGNPYSTIYNPPWLLFPLIPFAVLPYDLGRILMLVCAVVAFGLVAYRLKARPLVVALLILSPFVYTAIAWGNIEWLALLGLVTVPPVSFLLLMLKPQMTICVIAFLLIEMWRKNDRKRLLFSLGVMTVALAWSILAFGLWFSRLGEYLVTYTDSRINTSLFPYSVPFGIALFLASIQTRKIQFAIAASPCFFTMVTPQTWLVVMVALSSVPLALVAAVLGSWATVFYVKAGR